MKTKKPTRHTAIMRAVNAEQRAKELEFALDAVVGKWSTTSDDAAHLTKVICYLAAKHGAPLEVDASLMEQLPEGSKLSRQYDEERDVFIFACVRPKQHVEVATGEEQAGLKVIA